MYTDKVCPNFLKSSFIADMTQFFDSLLLAYCNTFCYYSLTRNRVTIIPNIPINPSPRRQAPHSVLFSKWMRIAWTQWISFLLLLLYYTHLQKSPTDVHWQKLMKGPRRVPYRQSTVDRQPHISDNRSKLIW